MKVFSGIVYVFFMAVAIFVIAACSDSFTDERDGKSYKMVEIGGRLWMAENLDYAGIGANAGAVSSNGALPSDGGNAVIGDGGNAEASAGVNSGTADRSFCPEGDERKCREYGRLYSWEAAQKACPAGWRLPSREDFLVLLAAVQSGSDSAIHALDGKVANPRDEILLAQSRNESDGNRDNPGDNPAEAQPHGTLDAVQTNDTFAAVQSGSNSSELFLNLKQPNVAGRILKSTSGWFKKGNGTDDVGFKALPAGYSTADGKFDGIGGYAYFWSSTSDPQEPAFAYYLFLDFSSPSASLNSFSKEDARSVRCVRSL